MAALDRADRRPPAEFRHSDKQIFSFAANDAKVAPLSEWALKSLHLQITGRLVPQNGFWESTNREGL
jgi:hypothetical protein